MDLTAINKILIPERYSELLKISVHEDMYDQVSLNVYLEGVEVVSYGSDKYTHPKVEDLYNDAAMGIMADLYDVILILDMDFSVLMERIGSYETKHERLTGEWRVRNV